MRYHPEAGKDCILAMVNRIASVKHFDQAVLAIIEVENWVEKSWSVQPVIKSLFTRQERLRCKDTSQIA
jgi:hypothetical protein